MHGLRGLSPRLATWVITAMGACRREDREERKEGEEENGGEGRGKKRREMRTQERNEQTYAWEKLGPQGHSLR